MIARDNGERLAFLHAAEVALIREALGAFPAGRVWGLMAKLTHQEAQAVTVSVADTAQIEAAMGPVEQLVRWESQEAHGAWERRP